MRMGSCSTASPLPIMRANKPQSHLTRLMFVRARQGPEVQSKSRCIDQETKAQVGGMTRRGKEAGECLCKWDLIDPEGPGLHTGNPHSSWNSPAWAPSWGSPSGHPHCGSFPQILHDTLSKACLRISEDERVQMKALFGTTGSPPRHPPCWSLPGPGDQWRSAPPQAGRPGPSVCLWFPSLALRTQ